MIFKLSESVLQGGCSFEYLFNRFGASSLVRYTVNHYNFTTVLNITVFSMYSYTLTLFQLK